MGRGGHRVPQSPVLEDRPMIEHTAVCDFCEIRAPMGPGDSDCPVPGSGALPEGWMSLSVQTTRKVKQKTMERFAGMIEDKVPGFGAMVPTFMIGASLLCCLDCQAGAVFNRLEKALNEAADRARNSGFGYAG